MLIEVDDRELDTILAALRHWQEGLTRADRQPPSAELMEIAENDRKGGDAALLPEEIDDLCERFNFELPEAIKRELAWKLFDEVGISVLVALDVDSLIADRDDADLPPVPRETLLEAMHAVANGDWSDISTGAKEAVERLTNGQN